jgi:hypothetical protein
MGQTTGQCGGWDGIREQATLDVTAAGLQSGKWVGAFAGLAIRAAAPGIGGFGGGIPRAS